ncbi:MAG: hypothetical protein HC919_14320 [Oscillatoriales cyanobacterium SM2_2_1]|nr:hypothetical protein [Oscillatoriales cyanobacterium SM2_2_1]
MASFVSWLVGAALFFLAVYGLLGWLNVPAGNVTNWLAIAGIFIWLLVIATVPWNIHFGAREVLSEAEVSRERGIPLEGSKLSYARMLAQRSLGVAIALHLITATALYVWAVNGIGAIGYTGAMAALLLTVLRPTIRFYEFLLKRLAQLRQGITYPREDVVELRGRVISLEQKIIALEDQFAEDNPNSFTVRQRQFQERVLSDLAALRVAQSNLEAQQRSDLIKISQESQAAIAQLSEDSRFLGQVRELIRFFKSVP